MGCRSAIADLNRRFKMSVQLVQSEQGDWEGIYIDGRLEFETHMLTARDVLQALGIEYEQIYCDLEENGRCPDTFDEALNLEINDE